LPKIWITRRAAYEEDRNGEIVSERAQPGGAVAEGIPVRGRPCADPARAKGRVAAAYDYERERMIEVSVWMMNRASESELPEARNFWGAGGAPRKEQVCQKTRRAGHAKQTAPSGTRPRLQVRGVDAERQLFTLIVAGFARWKVSGVSGRSLRLRF